MGGDAPQANELNRQARREKIKDDFDAKLKKRVSEAKVRDKDNAVARIMAEEFKHHKTLQLRPAVFRQYSTVFNLMREGQEEVKTETLADKLHLAPSRAAMLFAEIDLDDSGTLDFEEFTLFLLKGDGDALMPSDIVDGDISSRLAALNSGGSFRSDDWDPSDSELRRYRLLFDVLDVDNSKTLTLDEIAEGVKVDKNLEAITDVMASESKVELTFDEFVKVMQNYELASERDIADATLSVQEATGKAAPAEIPLAIARIKESIGVDITDKELDSAAVLRLLGMEMHSGMYKTTQDDYRLYLDLQRRCVVEGVSTFTSDFLGSDLEAFAGSVFLNDAFLHRSNRGSGPDVAQGGLLSVGNASQDGEEGGATARVYKSLNAEQQVLFHTAFQKIDTDFSGSISAEELNAVLHKLMEKGLEVDQLGAVFTLLESIDGRDEEINYRDFVRIVYDSGDVHLFDSLEMPTVGENS